jgi:hypothetical protein
MHKLRESIDEQQKASLEMTTEEKLIVLDFTIHKIKMYKEENKDVFICNIIKQEFDLFDTLKISFPELHNALQKRLKFLRNKHPDYYNYNDYALWRGYQYAERIKFLNRIKKKLLKNNHE